MIGIHCTRACYAIGKVGWHASISAAPPTISVWEDTVQYLPTHIPLDLTRCTMHGGPEYEEI